MQILAQTPVITVQTDEDTCIISITITNEELNKLSCPYCHASLTRFGYYHKHPRTSAFNLRLLRLANPELSGTPDKLKIIVPRLCCTSKSCPVAERNKSRLTTFGIFNPRIFMPFRQYLPALMDLTEEYIEAEGTAKQSDSETEKQEARKTVRSLNKKLSPSEDEADNDFFRDFITPFRKFRIKELITSLKRKADYFFDKLLLTNYLTPEQSSAPLINHSSPYSLPSDSILSFLLFLLSNYVPLLPTQIAIFHARTYWIIHLNDGTDSSEKGGEFNDSS